MLDACAVYGKRLAENLCRPVESPALQAVGMFSKANFGLLRRFEVV
jgi:hypothetical protein